MGTGNDGRIYKSRPAGPAAPRCFDATELQIHAMRKSPNGGIYAGSSPDGEIYRIDHRNGTTTTFFDPDEVHRALAVDSRGHGLRRDRRGCRLQDRPTARFGVLQHQGSTYATALAVDHRRNRLSAPSRQPRHA